MRDVALAGAPLDAAEARQLISRTKAGVKLSRQARAARGLRREGQLANAVQRPKMQSRGAIYDRVEGGFCRNSK
jgi:hypothetical protein